MDQGASSNYVRTLLLLRIKIVEVKLLRSYRYGLDDRKTTTSTKDGPDLFLHLWIYLRQLYQPEF